MDKNDYHFISIKFLSAILMALFFAFLLLYVFSPAEKDYSVYSLEREKIKELPAAGSAAPEDFSAAAAAEKSSFKSELKNRSFKIMAQSKKAVLTVITGRHLEKINGLKEEGDLRLNDFKLNLESEEQRLLQQKRNDLETELSSKLQKLRLQVKEKYSDYSQQEIRDNYLKMINLRIAVEVLAQNESEKEQYQEQLQQLRTEQEKLLAEKNEVLSEEISDKTRTLIMEFNREYTAYREELRERHQNLIAKQETEINQNLNRQRQEIRLEMQSEREEKAAVMDRLISKSREYY